MPQLCATSRMRIFNFMVVTISHSRYGITTNVVGVLLLITGVVILPPGHVQSRGRALPAAKGIGQGVFTRTTN